MRRLIMVMALLFAATPVLAQTVGTYVEQNGATKNQIAVVPVGPAASGAPTVAAPVRIGCNFNTTPPTVTTGQTVDVQCDNRGSVEVTQMFAGLATADANGSVVQKGLSSTAWTYASGTAGILSNTTTAVTFKSAAGASVRNYIDSCNINTTAFGVAAPLAFRDGAGGTVIWALNVPSAGFLNPVSIVFETPLRSTANTLLEVVTTTANVTGTAYVNCQGHTGP